MAPTPPAGLLHGVVRHGACGWVISPRRRQRAPELRIRHWDSQRRPAGAATPRTPAAPWPRQGHPIFPGYQSYLLHVHVSGMGRPTPGRKGPLVFVKGGRDTPAAAEGGGSRRAREAPSLSSPGSWLLPLSLRPRVNFSWGLGFQKARCPGRTAPGCTPRLGHRLPVIPRGCAA